MAVVIIDRQTAKFNSPPNFPAIQYDSGLLLLAILESVGHAATMFVATPIIMDSHSTISPQALIFVGGKIS